MSTGSGGGAGAGGGGAGSGSESGSESQSLSARVFRPKREEESKQQYQVRKDLFEALQEKHAILKVTLTEAEEAAREAVVAVKRALKAVKACEQRMLDVSQDVSTQLDEEEEAALE